MSPPALLRARPAGSRGVGSLLGSRQAMGGSQGRRGVFDHRLFLIKSQNSAILTTFKREESRENAADPADGRASCCSLRARVLRGASPRLPPKWGAGACPRALAFKRKLHKEHLQKKQNHGKLIASLRHVSSDVATLDFFQSKRGPGNQSLTGGREEEGDCNQNQVKMSEVVEEGCRRRRRRPGSAARGAGAGAGREPGAVAWPAGLGARGLPESERLRAGREPGQDGLRDPPLPPPREWSAGKSFKQTALNWKCRGFTQRWGRRPSPLSAEAFLCRLFLGLGGAWVRARPWSPFRPL